MKLQLIVVETGERWKRALFRYELYLYLELLYLSLIVLNLFKL